MRALRPTALSLAALCCLFAACGDTELPSGNGGRVNPPGNRPPIINPVAPQTVNEGQTLRIVLAVNDPDGDSLYLEAHNLPEDAVLDPVQGLLTYRPSFDLVSGAEGSLTLPDITVTVDDTYLSASTVISITVVHVNRRPFFLSADGGALSALEVEVEPATERRVRFQVIDPDEEPVTLSLVASPAYAVLEEQTLVLTPSEADRGSVAEFALTADDGAERIDLPVRVVVGALDVDLPLPTGLTQEDDEGAVPVGETVFEGELTFGAAAHTFDYGPLRLQVEVTPVGMDYTDGSSGIGDPVGQGTPSRVVLRLDGGDEYRWRARFLSDEFGAGRYVSFGGNTEADADLVVSIVPATVLDVVPHDPSPIDVTFGYFSPNVSDFECRLDNGAWGPCNARVDCCPGGSCPPSRSVCVRQADCTCAVRSMTVTGNGRHTFGVRAVTRDGLADPDPETYAWDVLDLPPPDVFLTSTPVGTVGCSAEYRFSSSDTAARFECRLDPPPPRSPGSFAPCSSPRTVTLTEPGSYTFHVRAVNIVNVAGEPVSHAFVSDCGS
jgi:hypothetical protein